MDRSRHKLSIPLNKDRRPNKKSKTTKGATGPVTRADFVDFTKMLVEIMIHGFFALNNTVLCAHRLKVGLRGMTAPVATPGPAAVGVAPLIQMLQYYKNELSTCGDAQKAGILENIRLYEAQINNICLGAAPVPALADTRTQRNTLKRRILVRFASTDLVICS